MTILNTTQGRIIENREKIDDIIQGRIQGRAHPAPPLQLE